MVARGTPSAPLVVIPLLLRTRPLFYFIIANIIIIIIIIIIVFSLF